jgi:hypothetical protein
VFIWNEHECVVWMLPARRTQTGFFIFIFEEMLGWQQKILWIATTFLYSFTHFGLENALHPFIRGVFIQI